MTAKVFIKDNLFYLTDVFKLECNGSRNNCSLEDTVSLEGKPSLVVRDWYLEVINSFIVVSNVNTKIYYKFYCQDGVVFIHYFDDSKEDYVYFRKVNLHKFINRFGLDTIKNCDPNKDYLINISNYQDKQNTFRLITDGFVDEKILHVSHLDGGLDISYDFSYTVRDSTFVYLTTIRRFDPDRMKKISSILYTTKDLEEVTRTLEKHKSIINSKQVGVIITRD